jgi:hypothetical protein
MKLSNRVRLVLIVIVMVVALAVLFTVYSRQAAERRDLNAKLEEAQILLVGLGHQKDTLEDDLGSALSALNAYRAEFPGAVESIEYGNDLFEVASDCNVRITGLTAAPPVDKKVGGVTYSVSSFVVGISGTAENMRSFVDAIGTGIDTELSWGFQLPWSVEVKSVSMDISRSAATINLDIYGYRG